MYVFDEIHLVGSQGDVQLEGPVLACAVGVLPGLRLVSIVFIEDSPEVEINQITCLIYVKAT